jgi:aspartate/methionine/tyrosine aminotransferase
VYRYRMRLEPFKLERYFAQHEFNVEYSLCSSDCESWSIEELLALELGAEERFKRHWLGYTESLGAPGLRAAAAALYEGIEPTEILVHAGAQEAIFLFMHAALEPGDHIIVHWPCYQSLESVAAGMGCEVTRWEARAENGWRLDLDDLRTLLRPATRVIVVNTPHNPTGWLMPRGDYDALVRLADERSITLFSDEVYRGLEYERADRLPSACEFSERAVSLGVMSKAYGLAGLRIGWVATRDAALRERMAALKDYTTICCSAPSEFLAELALRHADTLVRRNVQIIRSNLALLDGFFARHAGRFDWVRPQAGPIAFPRLLDGDVERFCDRLRADAGVLLLPGTIYDYPGGHFRLGFARRNMPDALARFEEWLAGS